MVFVDTGAWFALSVISDPDHAAAKDFIEQNRDVLVTSDYVVDELLTLFIVRRAKVKGIEWLRDVFRGLSVIRVESGDFSEAMQVYSDFTDKAWSFTDCTSYVMMRRLKISTAFSFDSHFREFGTVQIVPQ
jgi:predicted nucleic acid-binding protein